MTGFALAPLWVPLSVAAYAFLFSGEATFGLALLAIPISTLFAYLGAFVLAIPAFLMLRSRRLTGLAGTSALGSAIAGALWFFFLLCFDRRSMPTCRTISRSCSSLSARPNWQT